MSYEIEYTKRALKSKNKYGNDAYICWSTVASNNVSPRTPSPMLLATGQEWEVISKICQEIAPSCESGCWKPRNRWTTPEAYLKSWRKVLKDAVSLEDFLQSSRLMLRLEMPKEKLKQYLATEPTNPNPDGWRWKEIGKLLEGLPLEERKWFDEEHLQTYLYVKSYTDIERMMNLYHFLSDEKLLCWRISLEV
jgi:hypothetical protein